MIGAAFRLGFVAACCLLVLGLVVVADRWGVAVAVIVGVVGVTAAVVLSEDWSSSPDTKPDTASGVRARAPRPWRRTSAYKGDD